MFKQIDSLSDGKYFENKIEEITKEMNYYKDMYNQKLESKLIIDNLRSEINILNENLNIKNATNENLKQELKILNEKLFMSTENYTNKKDVNNYFCKCNEFDYINRELSKSKSIINQKNIFINQLQSTISDLQLYLENEQYNVQNLNKKLYNSNEFKEIKLSEINSVIDYLDKEYENSIFEIKNLTINNNELINEKNELMSINSDLKSELQSHNESLSELNELRKINIELQDEIDTLTINTCTPDYKEELESLQIRLDEFAEQASKAEQLESELHELRYIKHDYDKTYTELNYEKTMNQTFVSIIEQKHYNSCYSTDDYSLDPHLMIKEIEEMKDVNKWLRQELKSKENCVKDLNDKIDSLNYLNQQFCRYDINSKRENNEYKLNQLELEYDNSEEYSSTKKQSHKFHSRAFILTKNDKITQFDRKLF